MVHVLPLFAAALPLGAAIAIVALRLRDVRAARTALAGLCAGAAFAVAALVATVVRSDNQVGNAVLASGRVTALLGLLTLAVAVVVVAFAGRALIGDVRSGRFFAAASALVAATVVTAYAASGATLVVGWVATSVALTVLVGHHASWSRAQQATKRLAYSLGLGDAALIAGVVVAAFSVGNVDLRDVDAAAVDLGDGSGTALTAVAVLLVIAGISRSSLFPVHRWLPGTLVAPTPVSAILHAGVVNGAGVLLIKTAPIAGASTLAMAVLFAAGAITAVMATAVMITRSDVKGGLAWSTAGQMGFMAVQVAVGAFAAAVFHIVGHAMYKAALFLGAGSAVDVATASRRRPHVAALTKRTRIISVAIAALAAASIGGAAAALNPAGPAAGTVLVVVFGWLMVARLTHGWLAGTQAAGSATAIAAGVALMMPWAYVGALAAFKSFVSVPDAFDGAVPAGVVIAILAAIGLAGSAIAWLPGERGTSLRRAASAALIGIGTPSHGTVRRTPAAPDMRTVATPSANTTTMNTAGNTADADQPSPTTTWRATA